MTPRPALADGELDATSYDALRLTGFSHDELALAFDRVRDGHDWKGPIRAEIPVEAQAVVEHAIIWFTATSPTFALSERGGMIVVTAGGYRKGPWGSTVTRAASLAPAIAPLPRLPSRRRSRVWRDHLPPAGSEPTVLR